MGLPYGENFNRFRLIHPCDAQTDGRTDGRAIAYTRYRNRILCCRA